MLGQLWILQLKQDYNISVEAGFRIGDHMESSMPLSEYNFGKFNQQPSLTIKAEPLFSIPLSCSPHSESSPSHWSTSSSDTTLWLSFSSYTSLTPSVFFTASVFSFWLLNTAVPWSSVLGPLRFSIHSHCLYQAERWSPKRLVCFLIPGNCGFYFILQKSEYYLILPKMWLRILRGVYLGLPRWTLNPVTSVLIRKSQTYPTDRRGGSNVAL